MELIIIIVAIIAIITIFFMMKTNVKELEEIALDKELNSIAEKFPDNTEICKSILRKIENKTTQIEEDQKSEASRYFDAEMKIGRAHV